jgi:beta-phosphoglucomutase
MGGGHRLCFAACPGEGMAGLESWEWRMAIGILWDMDGVLVDSGAAHHESWQVLAKKHGLDVSAEEFHATFGRPSRDIIKLLWGADVSDDEIAAIDEEKEVVYRDLVRGRVPLKPGCRETLGALRAAGYPMAVATSGPPANVELVLEEGELRDFFGAQVNGFDIAHGKPAPDCFLLAAERLRLAGADCVVIEDAPVGLQAAQAAGMPTIALAGTHAAEKLAAAGATRVVATLGEITPALIEACHAER